ncbi:MAG: addiction module toxin RelE [Methyloprofundus sp.]|nr:addiction module toxin RelE [Methyloprofundus sp.]
MARPLRIEYAGALYHVTSRGDRCENIYHDDNDRLIWLDVFSQVCSRFNWCCHAWCLMDNHYHLVIETLEGNLSQGMRQLNGVYTQKVNRKHGRVGHVFQGRYKAILIEKEAHLLELARYVVLNPVRANIINNVHDWQWSSYPAMIEQKISPKWLETDWLLSQFGNSRQDAIEQYKNFVHQGIELPPVWQGLKNQMYLGSEQFIEKIQALYSPDNKDISLQEVPRVQRRSVARDLKWYEGRYRAREKAMTEAYLSGDYTMKEIATWFGVHYSTVSRAVHKAENA